MQGTKNTIHGSYGTIHTFKNYFATVFSVFSFSKNKLNPNGPLVIESMLNQLRLKLIPFYKI